MRTKSQKSSKPDSKEQKVKTVPLKKTQPKKSLGVTIHPSKLYTVSGRNVNSKMVKRQLGRIPNVNGIIDDVISTGTSVAKTVSSLAEGNPLGLLEIPNSVMKVIDTTKNIIRNVTSSDATEKIVLKDKEPINDVQNRMLIKELSKNMPVITTTQLPSSYSTEYSQAPLQQTFRVENGRRISNIRGSFALPPYFDENVVGQLWNYKIRLTPQTGLAFGPRVATIANTFQMYRLNSCNASTIPTQGTDFVGNTYLNFMEGTDLSGPYSTSVSYQTVSERECAQPGSLKTGSNLTYKGKGDWLYVSDSMTGNDVKWFASATFGLLTYMYTPASPSNRLGHVVMTFDIDFLAQSDASWSFQDQMKKHFFGIWLSSCQIPIQFDRWLAIVWKGIKTLRNWTENNEIESFINQKFIEEDQKLYKKYRALEDERNRCLSLRNKEISKTGKIDERLSKTLGCCPIHFGCFVDSVELQPLFQLSKGDIEDLNETIRKSGFRYDICVTDIFGPLALRKLVAMMTLYFQDFSGFFFESDVKLLDLLRKIAYKAYRHYNPIDLSQFVEPHSDDSDDENANCEDLRDGIVEDYMEVRLQK